MLSPKEKREKAKKLSQRMKEKWADPEFLAKRSETQSEIMKEKWANDQEFATYISTKNRERGQDPEFKANLSITMTNLYSTPEKRQQLSETRITSLSNPQIYNAHVQMTRDTAPQRSEKMKDRWQDPQYCYNVMKGRYGKERALNYVYKKFGEVNIDE